MTNSKLISSVLVMLIAGGVLVGAYQWNQHRIVQEKIDQTTKPLAVEIVNTPHKNNSLVPPEGFPADIPVEKSKITESNLATYPEQGMVLRNLTFTSGKTKEQQRAVYVAYMQSAGYAVKEGENDLGVISLSGTKAGFNLNIVISQSSDSTLVQISHLSFSR